MNEEFPAGFAFVAGGSGGIGQAICTRLARAGADIALTYHRNAQAADKVVETVKAGGRRAIALSMAAEDPETVRAAILGARQALGRMHTLVYASGPFVEMRHISKIEPALFRDYINQDAVGFFNIIHFALPALRAGGGAIVAVHTAGLRRWPVRDALSAAPKAAVDMLIKGLSREEGRYNIRANAVGVAMIQAGMHWRLRERGDYTPERLEAMRRNRSVKEPGRAEDVAEAVLFFSSETRSRFVTGQTLNVDGGYAV